MRGVTCDVWVAERGITKGRYSTVEVLFSHKNWTVEIEVFNKARQVPIGISTYVADAVRDARIKICMQILYFLLFNFYTVFN